jgi:hypothetical protein
MIEFIGTVFLSAVLVVAALLLTGILKVSIKVERDGADEVKAGGTD